MSEIRAGCDTRTLSREVHALGAALTGFDPAGAGESAELIGLVAVLEDLKCRVEGAQVAAAAAFDTAQRSARLRAG